MSLGEFRKYFDLLVLSPDDDSNNEIVKKLCRCVSLSVKSNSSILDPRAYFKRLFNPDREVDRSEALIVIFQNLDLDLRKDIEDALRRSFILETLENCVSRFALVESFLDSAPFIRSRITNETDPFIDDAVDYPIVAARAQCPAWRLIRDVESTSHISRRALSARVPLGWFFTVTKRLYDELTMCSAVWLNFSVEPPPDPELPSPADPCDDLDPAHAAYRRFLGGSGAVGLPSVDFRLAFAQRCFEDYVVTVRRGHDADLVAGVLRLALLSNPVASISDDGRGSLSPGSSLRLTGTSSPFSFSGSSPEGAPAQRLGDSRRLGEMPVAQRLAAIRRAIRPPSVSPERPRMPEHAIVASLSGSGHSYDRKYQPSLIPRPAKGKQPDTEPFQMATIHGVCAVAEKSNLETRTVVVPKGGATLLTGEVAARNRFVHPFRPEQSHAVTAKETGPCVRNSSPTDPASLPYESISASGIGSEVERAPLAKIAIGTAGRRPQARPLRRSILVAPSRRRAATAIAAGINSRPNSLADEFTEAVVASSSRPVSPKTDLSRVGCSSDCSPGRRGQRRIPTIPSARGPCGPLGNSALAAPVLKRRRLASPSPQPSPDESGRALHSLDVKMVRRMSSDALEMPVMPAALSAAQPSPQATAVASSGVALTDGISRFTRAAVPLPPALNSFHTSSAFKRHSRSAVNTSVLSLTEPVIAKTAARCEEIAVNIQTCAKKLASRASVGLTRLEAVNVSSQVDAAMVVPGTPDCAAAVEFLRTALTAQVSEQSITSAEHRFSAISSCATPEPVAPSPFVCGSPSSDVPQNVADLRCSGSVSDVSSATGATFDLADPSGISDGHFGRSHHGPLSATAGRTAEGFDIDLFR